MLWYVGGYVRDQKNINISTNSCKFKDIDIAIEGFNNYEEMKNYLINCGASIYTEKPETATLKCDLSKSTIEINQDMKKSSDPNPRIPIDIVMCRQDDIYDPRGRFPLSVKSGTILQDLARRDFTFNAMAINVKTGEFLDPYNGLDDLNKYKTIKCVGNPVERFGEDPLRILRAIRFAIRFNFAIEEKTFSAMCDKTILEKLLILSSDRVRNELTLCFEIDTFKTLKFITKLGIEDILFNKLKLQLKCFYKQSHK